LAMMEAPNKWDFHISHTNDDGWLAGWGNETAVGCGITLIQKILTPWGKRNAGRNIYTVQKASALCLDQTPWSTISVSSFAPKIVQVFNSCIVKRYILLLL
jgi:hypothetical protein